MKELSTEKVMTVKEVASVLGVSKDTIFNCIKRIMPNKMQERKTTFLNEKEVSLISKELKGNNAVLDRLSVEVSSTVVNTTTELEILANYKQAQEQFTQLLERKNAELQNIINEQKPKVEFYDAVTATETECDMSTVAKVLNMGVGRNKLFSFLKEKGVLRVDNSPYQKQVDLGRFRITEERYKRNGKEEVYFKTTVTQKGIDYIRKLLDKECNICYT